MIDPTIALARASGQQWDAVVVGAGPAGALAAGELARLGASVLLIDRSAFPRPKVCGCCLNQRALAVLAAAGLGELVDSAGGMILGSMCLAAGRRTAGLRLAGGVALSRSAFDASLVRAAIHRGAGFLPATHASLGKIEAVFRRIHLRGQGEEGEVKARVVLAADGLGGLFLQRGGVGEARIQHGSRIGAGVVIDAIEPFYKPGVVYMTCGRAGYVGLVRLEDGRLDLACALDASAVRASSGPGSLACELLAQAGWPVPPGLAEQPWRGTAPLTRQARRVAGERLFALGDATGYVEPFTGEGMAWALASAAALAPLALRATRSWEPSFVQEWTALHQRIVTRRQIACRLLAAVLRRPWLTAAVVAVLGRLPLLAVPVIRYLNHPDRPGRPLATPRPLVFRDIR